MERQEINNIFVCERLQKCKRFFNKLYGEGFNMLEKSIKVKANEILEKNENNIAEGVDKPEQTKTATVKYSVEELAASSSQLFGVPTECVVAACMLAGIKEATEPEAKKIINEFMKREV